MHRLAPTDIPRIPYVDEEREREKRTNCAEEPFQEIKKTRLPVSIVPIRRLF